jgi:hypothetical protein
VNGGTTNHTHQISNFRINNSDNVPIQLASADSAYVSGILDVGTTGKAWNDVLTAVIISKVRTSC